MLRELSQTAGARGSSLHCTSEYRTAWATPAQGFPRTFDRSPPSYITEQGICIIHFNITFLGNPDCSTRHLGKVPLQPLLGSPSPSGPWSSSLLGPQTPVLPTGDNALVRHQGTAEPDCGGLRLPEDEDDRVATGPHQTRQSPAQGARYSSRRGSRGRVGWNRQCG